MMIQEDLDKECRHALERVVDYVGSQQGLAYQLGVSRQVVNNWLRRGRVSLVYAIIIEKVSRGRFSRYDLRPDHFKVNK